MILSSLLVLCGGQHGLREISYFGSDEYVSAAASSSFTSAHHSPTDRVRPADAVTKSQNPYRQNSCSPRSPGQQIDRLTRDRDVIFNSGNDTVPRSAVLRCWQAGRETNWTTAANSFAHVEPTEDRSRLNN